MKQPEDCSNIQEIRIAIDQLDREIINLLGTRFNYVKAASKFKNSETSVKAPKRFQTMLKQRRVWAESAKLNPDVIEEMYCNLVNYFIEEELNFWRNE